VGHIVNHNCTQHKQENEIEFPTLDHGKYKTPKINLKLLNKTHQPKHQSQYYEHNQPKLRIKIIGKQTKNVTFLSI